MVSGLEDSSWTISLDLLSATGINEWYFLDGLDSLAPTQIMLDMSSTLFIKSAIASVPEPNLLPFLGLGLIGFGLFRALKRKQFQARVNR